jgi:hypothetical protein
MGLVRENISRRVFEEMQNRSDLRLYEKISRQTDSQPEERGIDFVYKNNSAARMLKNLKHFAPRNIDKIVCIDCDVREIERT